jgi:hypothetical protein
LGKVPQSATVMLSVVFVACLVAHFYLFVHTQAPNCSADYIQWLRIFLLFNLCWSRYFALHVHFCN